MLLTSANESSPGRRKEELETPTLCLDIGAYHRNARRMADYIVRQCGIQWRPHMKGQKAPELARLAVDAGAIGVTCATVYEAQAMASAGIADILLAHETVGAHKLRRLAGLQHLARVISATDSVEHLAMLAVAARDQGVEIPVLIEVNVGMDRAGAAPGRPTVELAKRALDTKGIRFTGLMGWEGHALRYEDEEKVRRIEQSVTVLLETADLCRAAGIELPIVSASGSGTFLHSSHRQGLTEVQAGGAVFCDLSYQRWGVPHEFALTVLTRVVSRPTATRIIVDGGFKTMSHDHGLPQPLGLSAAVKSFSLSAEHGTLELESPSETPRVGDLLEFIPGYTDSTVCLHDELCVLRDGVVEAVWCIPGRSGRR